MFNFLDPKWYIDESEVFDSSEYRFDDANKHLKLKTKDNIKVDFLLNEMSISKPNKNTILDLDFELYYESIDDIIAKKINFRKTDNLTRDIFDLAVAIEYDKDILQNLLFSRYITNDDLTQLTKSLKGLDTKLYKLEIEKVEPAKSFEHIAQNARDIILDNLHNINH
jgi:hypothetical protein